MIVTMIAAITKGAWLKDVSVRKLERINGQSMMTRTVTRVFEVNVKLQSVMNENMEKHKMSIVDANELSEISERI